MKDKKVIDPTTASAEDLLRMILVQLLKIKAEIRLRG